MRKLILILLLSASAWAQTPVMSRTETFIAAAAGVTIANIGGRALYYRINFYPIGAPGSCTVAVDSSLDGSSWSAGGVITAQTCTSPGTFTTSAQAVYNYIRINVTALSANKSVTVNVSGYEVYPTSAGTTPTAVNCANFSGANTGAQIINCIAAGPSTFAVYDASSLPAGNATSTISVAKPMRLILPASLTSSAATAAINVTANADIGCGSASGSSAANCNLVVSNTTANAINVASGAAPNIHDLNIVYSGVAARTAGSGIQLRMGAGGAYARLRIEKTWIGINQAEGGSSGFFRDIQFQFANATNGAWHAFWVLGGCTGAGAPAALNCAVAQSATITDSIVENVIGSLDAATNSGVALLIDGGTDSFRFKNVIITSSGACVAGDCATVMLQIQNTVGATMPPTSWFRCTQCAFEGSTVSPTVPAIWIKAGLDIRFLQSTAITGGRACYQITPGSSAGQWIQDVEIAGGTIAKCGRQGVLVENAGGATTGPNGSAVSNVSIHDNVISGTSQDGNGSYPAIQVAANAGKFSIKNNNFDTIDSTVVNFPSYYVSIAAGTSDFYEISGNNFASAYRATGDFTDGGTGVNKIIGPNMGTTETTSLPSDLTVNGSITGNINWSNITSPPTTLAGYGITDALPLAGGTMTGAIVAATPATGQESIILPFGVNPTTPTAGSLWCRSADNFCYIRANGVSQAIAWQSSLSSMPGVGILAQTDTASPPTLVNRTITGTSSYITVSDGAGTAANPTITIAAGPVRTRVCEIHVYGSGASGVLQDTDDVANACTNILGVTETLVGYGCWVDSTTGSPTATPIMADASTAIVTGAVSCTATTNTLAMGTLSGTPTLTSITLASGACASGNCAVNANITTAGGTATHMKHVFVFTH